MVYRRVSFSDQADVKSYLHISEYTDNEIEDAFISTQDFERISQSNRLTIELIDSELFVETRARCQRGLELKTLDGSRRRSRRTRMAYEEVFREQLRQRTSQELSDEDLAEVYKEASKCSVIEARLMAECDAVAAGALEAQNGTREKQISNESIDMNALLRLFMDDNEKQVGFNQVCSGVA